MNLAYIRKTVSYTCMAIAMGLSAPLYAADGTVPLPRASVEVNLDVLNAAHKEVVAPVPAKPEAPKHKEKKVADKKKHAEAKPKAEKIPAAEHKAAEPKKAPKKEAPKEPSKPVAPKAPPEAPAIHKLPPSPVAPVLPVHPPVPPVAHEGSPATPPHLLPHPPEGKLPAPGVVPPPVAPQDHVAPPALPTTPIPPLPVPPAAHGPAPQPPVGLPTKADEIPKLPDGSAPPALPRPAPAADPKGMSLDLVPALPKDLPPSLLPNDGKKEPLPGQLPLSGNVKAPEMKHEEPKLPEAKLPEAKALPEVQVPETATKTPEKPVAELPKDLANPPALPKDISNPPGLPSLSPLPEKSGLPEPSTKEIEVPKLPLLPAPDMEKPLDIAPPAKPDEPVAPISALPDGSKTAVLPDLAPLPDSAKGLALPGTRQSDLMASPDASTGKHAAVAELVAKSKSTDPDVRLQFNETETDVPPSLYPQLDSLAQKLASSPKSKINVLSFSGTKKDVGIFPKRVSLARGISVRNYLTTIKGIDIERVTVRALGNKGEADGVSERVDIFITN